MRRPDFRTVLLATTTIVASAALPLAAHAADAAAPADGGAQSTTLSEVVVTATKTGATQAQKTPLAITVVGGAQLDKTGMSNVKDLVVATPNLSVAQVTTNAAIYIRGIGSNNVFGGSDPDVTTEVDGVYMARAYSQFLDFVDVDRIEVLRGPQGTLYGRNAVGGVLNVVSRQPTDTFQATEELSVGNYNLIQNQFWISGPLVEGKVQGSIAFNYVRHDGYYQNIAPGGHDVGDANHGGVHAQLRAELTDRLTSTTRVDYSQYGEYPDSYDHLLVPKAYAPLASSIVGDYFKVAIDTRQYTKEIVDGASEQLDYRVNDHVSVKSITAARYGEYKLFNDTDGTERFINLGFQGDKDKTFSEELSVVGNWDQFTGVAGLYYFDEREKTKITSLVPPSPATPTAAAAFNDVEPLSRAQSEAAYAQGTYHITPSLNLTVGLRYTQDHKSIDQNFAHYSEAAYPVLGAQPPGFPFIASASRDFHAMTPKVGVDWQAADNVMLYASATRGYKSGGTTYSASKVSALTFAPETIWSYEAGVKSEWFDHRLRVNLTGFDYDYTNLQVQSLIGPGLVAIGNAATARVTGFELETQAKPTPDWLLTANVATLDAKYVSFPKASVPGALAPFLVGDPRYSAGPPATYNASGNYLNAAPRLSYTLAAQYIHDIGQGSGFVRAEYYWQDKVFYDPSNNPLTEQKAYGLINAAAGWNSPDDKWRVELIGRNLANQQYLITIAANGVAPAGVAGAPRTLMLRLTKNW